MGGTWSFELSSRHEGTRCDPGVATWFAGISREEVYLSALTIGEIRKGIENIRRRDERTAEALEAWLAELVATFSDRIVPIDESIAERWGRFNVPDPLPVIDGLLAATASVQGLVLVTRNIQDMERTGVAFLNPFSA